MLRGFASPEEVRALKGRGDELLSSFDPSALSSIFSTRNQVGGRAWEPRWQSINSTGLRCLGLVQRTCTAYAT